MVEVVPSWLEFGGGESCVIGGVKVVWTRDRDERDNKDDDEFGTGELFDALVEV